MKNSQDIVTADDFARSKWDGELRRLNKMAEKERRKNKSKSGKNSPNSGKNPRKRAMEELRQQELEEDEDY